jgi:hypothetical protein
MTEEGGRVCNLAVEHCQKKQDRTRETCGLRKFATACRGIARHARVAGCKRVVERKNWTHKNLGLPTVLTTARMIIACCAEVARHRGHDHKDCVVSGSLEGWTSGMRPKKGLGCNNGMRDQGSKQQLLLRKETTTSDSIRGRRRRQELCLRSQKTLYETLGQTFKLEVMKRAVVTSIRRRKTSIRTLWRGRPPPKHKQELQVEQEPAM